MITVTVAKHGITDLNSLFVEDVGTFNVQILMLINTLYKQAIVL